MQARIAFIVVSTLVACASGCSKEAPAETRADPAVTAPGAPSPEAEARKTFRTICVACHGADGKGDGPGAAALNPKPRNYTDVAWQNAVTDEQLKKTILMGGAAVGKSPSMPAQPQLQSKPEVVDALIKIIRNFKGK